MSRIIVAALYQFTPLSDYRELQPCLKDICDREGIKGTLLLASEGINGTVAGSRSAINTLKIFLETRFSDLEYKESWAENMPFHRMKVRLKKEIVTLGLPQIKPYEKSGTYVPPQGWNALISNPDVVVIDARNTYEIDIGTFEGALNPKTRSFTEFPKFAESLAIYKNQPVAMFCTGGIRCEKASSYLLSQGFKEIYQLEGGILNYLETISPEESLWRGDCFVFDGRVSVNHWLELGEYETCYGCRYPISEKDKASPQYERGVSCPHCYSSLTPEKAQSARERQYQEDLARKRGEKHLGAVMPTGMVTIKAAQGAFRVNF